MHTRSRAAAGCAIAAASLLAGCGSQHAVPDRFSGTWRLTDGRKIPIRRVSAHEGRAALVALRGKPCHEPTLYFRATYFGGGAHMAACATTPDGTRLRGRFDDNGIRGVIVQRKTADNRWIATITGDGGHAPFRVAARLVR